MPLTFTRAATLVPGEKLNAERWSSLTSALNDRLPYFDFVWRIAFFVLGAFRAVRNGSADGTLQAPWAEFFHSYQGLEIGQGSWPVALAGEPEGANLSNPAMGFHFGSPTVPGDAENLNTIPLVINGHSPATPEEMWALRRTQIGAIDHATGVTSALVSEAATNWYYFYQGPLSPHGQSWGGFQPSPAILGICEDPNNLDEYPPPYSSEVRFTATAAGIAAGFTDKIYAGTCPIGPTTSAENQVAYATHVAAIYRAPTEFLVRLNNGTIDVFPRNYYVEGPYHGIPKLRKASGEQLGYALDHFCAMHKGVMQNICSQSALHDAAAVRINTWLQGSFKSQDFFEQYYALAPERGTLVGSVVIPDPLTFTASSGNDSKRIAKDTIVGSHTINQGYVVRFVFVQASALSAACRVAVTCGDQSWAVTLNPSQSSSIINTLGLGGQVMSFKVLDPVYFVDFNGTLTFDASEQLAVKPDENDLFLILRIMGDPYHGNDMDASTLFSILERYGLLQNLSGQVVLQTPAADVTEAPTWEAFRLWSKCVRLLPSGAVVGYELDGSGRSVVYLKRNATWTGTEPTYTQVFSGAMAIRPGLDYDVRITPADKVFYNGNEYVGGQRFMGKSENNDFAIAAGSPTVFEIAPGILDPGAAADCLDGIADRILLEATAEAWSNRWLIRWDFKPYHESVSSIWKPDAYGNIISVNDRCTFMSPEIVSEYDKSALWQVAYGQKMGTLGNMISEMPTGYRFMPLGPGVSAGYVNKIDVPSANFNTSEDRQKFHLSAQIYEKSYEIIEAVTHIEGGFEIVRCVLNERVQNTAGQIGGAPSSIARDVGTWNLDALAAEPYETTETCLRKWIAHVATGRNFTTVYGDHAANSSIDSLTDNPYATCLPLTMLVKMIPEPRIDDNDIIETEDTPLYREPLAQISMYLRAMCESCVDLESSIDEVILYWQDTTQIPSAWSLHDYTWSEANRQGHGGAWVGIMPATETTGTSASRTRPDYPFGIMALPHCYWTAEMFNRLSGIVNLLTKFRVMLPWTLEKKERWYSGGYNIDIPFACNYPTGLTFGYADAQVPATASNLDYEDPTWVEAISAQPRAETYLLGCPWQIIGERVDVAWRVSLQLGSEATLPSYLAGLLNTSSVRLLVWVSSEWNASERVEVPPGTPGSYYDAGSGKYYVWNPVRSGTEQTATWINQGDVSPPLLPTPTDYGYYYSGTGDPVPLGGSQSMTTITVIPGQCLYVEVPLIDQV